MKKEQAIKEIQRHLWGWGYGVQDPRKFPGIKYDLLVNGKHRIIVLSDREENALSMRSDCDIVAYVKGTKKFYMRVLEPSSITARPQDLMDIENK
ncbi:MAG: hypothetical protein ACEQSB_06125 [Undibacterium sp.]